MCSSKSKLELHSSTLVSHINARPVLQSTCHRVPLLERHNSLNAKTHVSPKLNSSLTLSTAVNRVNDPHRLNSSVKKALTLRNAAKSVDTAASSTMKLSSSLVVEEAPAGSIAAARREEAAIMQVQRKMRIADYGRTKSAKYKGEVVPLDSSATIASAARVERRCSFITSNSDPIYVAYHDEEWGVPIHDDKLLFELLVLTGAQVGSDWTSVLKKRQGFRDAFLGFDAETVSKFTEKKISSISADCGIELSLIRGVVDNANRILEIKKGFGSFDKYLWGFVNHKPIATQYKSCHKIPIKTSKSESMSKDMVRRGFRFVGPTVIHSFMQATGLTNDHLITCSRHLQCHVLASPLPTVTPALLK